MQVGFIPPGSDGNGGFKIPHGRPLKKMIGFIDGKLKATCFVGGMGVAAIKPLTGDVFEELFDDGLDGAVGFDVGAEIEGAVLFFDLRIVWVGNFAELCSKP
jgi:hypothetical protein